MDNKKAVINCMRMFNEEYPRNFNISEDRVRLWCRMLEDFDSELILEASLQIIKQANEFPPPIGVFRSLVADMAHGIIKEPSPEEAWGKILDMIHHKDIELTDLERKALKMTGTIWDMRRTSDISGYRRQFINSFNAILRDQKFERQTTDRVKGFLEARKRRVMDQKPRVLSRMIEDKKSKSVPQEQQENSKNISDMKKTVSDLLSKMGG